MEYSEEKAKEIVQRFALNEKTIKVWRNRGAIPDKYTDAGYQPRKTIDKAGSVKHDRVIDLVQSGKINLEVFAGLCQVPAHRIRQAYPNATPRVLLSEQDLTACMVEIKRLKIDIAKCFEKFSPMLFKRLLNNPVINYSVIINDKAIAHRISYVRRGKAEPEKMLFADVKDKYVLFALQLAV